MKFQVHLSFPSILSHTLPSPIQYVSIHSHHICRGITFYFFFHDIGFFVACLFVTERDKQLFYTPLAFLCLTLTVFLMVTKIATYSSFNFINLYRMFSKLFESRFSNSPNIEITAILSQLQQSRHSGRHHHLKLTQNSLQMSYFKEQTTLNSGPVCYYIQHVYILI